MSWWLGRTGRFPSTTGSVRPDLMAKGSRRLSAAGDWIATIHTLPGQGLLLAHLQTAIHGCAALAISVYEEDRLIENARKMGAS